MELWYNATDGKNKIFEEKPVPLPLRSPEIPRPF